MRSKATVRNFSKTPLSGVTDWEPNNRPGPDGQLHVVGERKVMATYGDPAAPTTIGLFKGGPLVGSEFTFPTGDATGYVIQGEASVQLLDEGRTVHLEAGDLFHFRKGTRTQWTYHSSFIKFETVIP
jgi:uncharacterized cupin superfamily protein